MFETTNQFLYVFISLHLHWITKISAVFSVKSMVKSTFLVSPLRHLVGWVFQRTNPPENKGVSHGFPMGFPWFPMVFPGFSKIFTSVSCRNLPPSWSPACISQYGHDRLGYFGGVRNGHEMLRALVHLNVQDLRFQGRPGGETMAISDLDLLNTWDFNGTLFQYVEKYQTLSSDGISVGYKRIIMGCTTMWLGNSEFSWTCGGKNCWKWGVVWDS